MFIHTNSTYYDFSRNEKLLLLCIELAIGEGIVIVLRRRDHLLFDLTEFTVDELQVPAKPRIAHNREIAILKPEPMGLRNSHRRSKSTVSHRSRYFSIIGFVVIISSEIIIIVLEGAVLHQHILIANLWIGV